MMSVFSLPRCIGYFNQKMSHEWRYIPRVNGLAKDGTTREKGVSYRIDCAASILTAAVNWFAQGLGDEALDALWT